MRLSLLTLLTCSLTSLCATANDVGIDFDAMLPGTKLITQTRGDAPRRTMTTYLGKENGLHVMQINSMKDNKPAKVISKLFFDAQGRQVRAEKKGKMSSTHTPFSCEYVIGECKHTYVYANPFKKGKLVTHHDKLANRLEGQVLIVAIQKSDGSFLEIPYQLGAYNLRISSEYKNALGDTRGFKLIEIIEP